MATCEADIAKTLEIIGAVAHMCRQGGQRAAFYQTQVGMALSLNERRPAALGSTSETPVAARSIASSSSCLPILRI
jgi:hypothetical protein